MKPGTTTHTKKRLPDSFFMRDVLEVAPALLGKVLVRTLPNGEVMEHIITETEAYRGTDDKACHASKGLTPRTRTMFEQGGVLYMYLVYGMHWMLNVVTSAEGDPQAALIRGIAGAKGPGRVTRLLDLDKSFNGEHLHSSQRICIAESGLQPGYTTHPRIGIDYAGDYWKNKPWRYTLTHPLP
jgi:DNA-3-methyladenine glycosylase